MTVAALQFGALLAGAVVVENVFVLPGIGRLIVTAALVVDSVETSALADDLFVPPADYKLQAK